MKTGQTKCRRCGNCCKEGGPALHIQDLDLVKSGRIPISSLITIRKGELAYNPLVEKVQPITVELVKIVGTGGQWDCHYYDQESGCVVYADRPYACRVLRCWDTQEILQLVETDTLSRYDILDKNDSLVPVMLEHQRICPCDDLGFIQANLSQMSDQQKNDLQQRVRGDLDFRARVITDFQLKVSEELFYFGRPLFQLLQALGVQISESPEGIHLNW